MWLHGFTQTRDSAHQLRSILAARHEVWTLDLPGHGEARDLRCDLWEAADLVAEAIGTEAVCLAGYSMGARLALHVALAHPESVSALVLLGATRGILDESDRAARRSRDEALAIRIEELGVGGFLEEWLAQEMFADLPADPRERSARSDDAAGLAGALRLMGTGTQSFLGPRLGEIAVPTLALAGGEDPRFLAEARILADGVVDGRWAAIDRVRHAAHLADPVATAQVLADFLS